MQEWCEDVGIDYNIVCDEANLQGLMLFRKSREVMNKLVEHLAPTLKEEGVHLERQRVRNGTILAFSISAIAEADIERIALGAGLQMEHDSLADRISDVFCQIASPAEIPTPMQELREPTFLETAKRIVGEAQRKVPTKSYDHGRPTRFSRRDSINPSEKLEPKAECNRSGRGRRKKKASYEDLVKAALGIKEQMANPLAADPSQNGMQGMATPSNLSPDRVFQALEQALQNFGQSGIDILKLLRGRGVSWSRSTDGQSMIFFVNTQGGPFKIAQIYHTDLTKDNPPGIDTNRMTQVITDLLDYAKGGASGHTKHEQEVASRQLKAAQEVTKQFDTGTQNAGQLGAGTSQEMGQGMGQGMDQGMGQLDGPAQGIGGAEVPDLAPQGGSMGQMSGARTPAERATAAHTQGQAAGIGTRRDRQMAPVQ